MLHSLCCCTRVALVLHSLYCCTHVAIVALAFAREGTAGGERVTTSVRLVNRAAAPAEAREIVLEVDGHRVDARRVSLAPNAVDTVASDARTQHRTQHLEVRETPA